jgi:TnpA family transposase
MTDSTWLNKANSALKRVVDLRDSLRSLDHRLAAVGLDRLAEECHTLAVEAELAGEEIDAAIIQNVEEGLKQAQAMSTGLFQAAIAIGELKSRET